LFIRISSLVGEVGESLHDGGLSANGTEAALISGGMAFRRDARKFVRNSPNCRLSAKKLTQYIDLLWVYIWDSVTPIEEVMRGLDTLIQSGKILYIGVSDHPAWVVSQANTLAELKNWTPFVALWIEYSLIQRKPERELLPMAQEFGLTITPWSVLGPGLLAGKFSKTNFASGERQEEFERLAERRNEKKYGPRELAIADVVEEVAEANEKKFRRGCAKLGPSEGVPFQSSVSARCRKLKIVLQHWDGL
jgi:aryl-alcohol dehydrogenase-like predicted oxidoreductase